MFYSRSSKDETTFTSDRNERYNMSDDPQFKVSWPEGTELKIDKYDFKYSKDEINNAQEATIKKMNIKYGYVRPVIWRGSEMMAISAQKNKINVAVATWEWPSYFTKEDRLKGISLQTAVWKRPPPDCIPTDTKAAGLYMICTLSKHEAEKNGYTDALMLDYKGRVSESTGSNIFLVINGEIHTPVPDCFLNGITTVSYTHLTLPTSDLV